jgi:hypothetical protein
MVGPSRESDADDLRPEYDLSQLRGGVRGKYAGRKRASPDGIMTIELTEQQRRAVAQAGDSPPTVTDPETGTGYVLIRADVYAKLRAIVDGIAKRAGWDDPALNEYERYRKHT